MDDFLKKYKEEGLIIKQIKDRSIIDDTIEVVKQHFKDPIETYKIMKKEEFHDFSISCQNELNKLNLQKRFFKSEKDLFCALVPDDELLVESVVFLRVVLPKRFDDEINAVDFHRETFYSNSSHFPFVINTWIPIMNVNDLNTLKYIPRSHTIPDEILITEVDKNYPSSVKKFSSGHKMGFFWEQKRIISGVELSKAELMHFEQYDYSIFSSMLVHGNAINNSDKIRFVLGFGLVPKTKVVNDKMFFAANGGSQFISV